MSEGRSLLLLEENEGVIKDVVCSMRLIGIAVQVAHSVAECHSLALSLKPALVLVRARIKSSAQAAHELRARFAKDPEVCRLPLVVIGTSSELALLGTDDFGGQIAVPVEFPTFANEVQKKLVGLAGILSSRAPAPAAGECQLAVPEKASEVPPAGSEAHGLSARPESMSLENKLLAVYAIQMAVLDELKGSAAFLDAAPSEVAGRVAEVTAKVCKSFNVVKRIL